jgi:hypothetical protein
MENPQQDIQGIDHDDPGLELPGLALDDAKQGIDVEFAVFHLGVIHPGLPDKKVSGLFQCLDIHSHCQGILSHRCRAFFKRNKQHRIAVNS